MKNMFKAFLCLLTSAPLNVQAAVIHVPADQPSIQAGINAASNGDTVLVADSTYFENINFKGKAITVASYFLMDGDTAHIDSTIINGSQPSHADSGSVVYFISGEDTTSVLCGFTITGGTGTEVVENTVRAAGGVLFGNSGGTIKNNILKLNQVKDNNVYCYGGGLSSGPPGSAAYVIIENNQIENNTVMSKKSTMGGGIDIRSYGRISNNFVSNNHCESSSGHSSGGGIKCLADTSNRRFVLISGNTISNNKALAPNTQYGGYGGGIDVWGTDVEIMKNIITHNLVSGKDYCYGPGVRLVYTTKKSMIKNNAFLYNSFLNGGCHAGGLFLVITRGVKILDNHFEGNSGSWGAGIYDYSSKNTLISNNVFVSDTVDYHGGGMVIYLCNNNKIVQNEFIGNTATYSGGGIFEQECTNNKIIKNKIIKNSAQCGGGFYTYLSENSIISDNEICDNEAKGEPGGGIVVWDSHPKIIKNLISGNSTASYGGGLAIGRSSSKAISKVKMNADLFYNAAGGFSENGQSNHKQSDYNIARQAVTDTPTVLINNTITNNTAVLGGGLYNEFENVKIINTIIWGDSAISDPEISYDGGSLDITYSNIEGSWTGTGNIDVHPLFEDSLYHLSNSSACIDSGNPDPAYNYPEDPGNPGFALFPSMGGLRNDMGAYGAITDSLLITGLIEIEDKQTLPVEYILSQNYPNPFNPTTVISYQLPKSNEVELSIYNMRGQKVTTLVSKIQPAGTYKVEWDAQHFSSGVYLYSIKAGSYHYIKNWC